MIRRASISVKWSFSANAEMLCASEIPVLQGGSSLFESITDGCRNLLIHKFFLFEWKTS